MAETFNLTSIPIFSVGQWNGDTYTEADLDHMVAAFSQVGFEPPIKLGHDESQPLAKSDGMPAIGWVTNLRRMGQQLVCDIKSLPRKVYEAIRRKNYKRVSAEVYWDYEANGRKWPRVLKALALLGADVPAVTSLASLEALYDATGKPFRRYDMGMMPMPQPGGPTLVDTVGVDEDDECPKKDRTDVNYRLGGADDDGDGMPDFCGSCRYFDGAPDPSGTMVNIGNCSLVEGQVASSWLCDLYDPMEAFSAQQYTRVRPYIIRKRGDKWVLIAQSTGKVLGEHATREDALAQERVIQISKHGGAAMSPKTYVLTREVLADVCPSCVEKMDFLNIKELKITYDPVTKTYAGFSQGLCDRFGEAAGFRTRCMADSGKLAASVDDMGAFCNSLKEYCFGSVSAGESKSSQAGLVKTHGTKDAGSRRRVYMEIQEADGQFCVMKDGEKLKCFPTKEEASAYQTSMMAESVAEVKSLQMKLESAEREKRDLAAKVESLDTKFKELGDKVTAFEQRATAAEGERDAMQVAARKAENEGWIAARTTESNLKILPVERPYVAFVLEALDASGPTVKTYKEGEKELTVKEVVKRLFDNRKAGSVIFQEVSAGTGTETGGQGPKVVVFSSMAEARAEATRRAKVYMHDKGEKNFRTAYDHVLADDAELRQAASGVTVEGAQKAAEGAADMARIIKQ